MATEIKCGYILRVIANTKWLAKKKEKVDGAASNELDEG